MRLMDEYIMDEPIMDEPNTGVLTMQSMLKDNLISPTRKLDA